ncbi:MULTISPECIES: hypothetical protein [unclassified Streptomyces]|uniref:PH domain-containing protein n=1 Tax=Streptomyces sp. NBC_00119 TaxID=2975659 RepID=A0AAU1U466_9ACTN|nr:MULTISPECIES: hypothetical protein [unclassified Streptomyces]MCX4641627.1 hypothetical protein [Streptomyces sp. NBC_01446]MCX5321968.1 hypothetical protein [Streptomyces sp. NBC_00120]
MKRSGPRDTGDDRHWRGNARFALGCALVVCGMALLIDWDAGTLTTLRAGMWLTLTATVFAVLLPPRITAGDGWLAVHGLARRRRVRTDALVSVRQYGGVTAHLVLRDAYGHWLELDPRVLVANPLLWHELDTGAHRSRERGTLRHGSDVLRQLSEQIDDRTAREVLSASGLKP